MVCSLSELMSLYSSTECNEHELINYLQQYNEYDTFCCSPSRKETISKIRHSNESAVNHYCNNAHQLQTTLNIKPHPLTGSHFKTRNSAVAYDIWHTVQLQTTDWNSRGLHEYLLIYSFKLKSVSDACQLFRWLFCFVAKQYILQQVPESHQKVSS